MKKTTLLILWPKKLFINPPRGKSLALTAVLLIALLCLGRLFLPFWWPFSLFTLGSPSPSLQGKVIVIDPGHGGTDPGAKYQGLLEKHINLAISLKVAEILKQRGAKVTLTRTTDVDFYKSGWFGSRREKKRSELNQRVQLAEDLHADLFISIHANQDRQPSCYGIETFYHPQSATGRKAAETLQEELRKLQPRNRRLAKAGDYYLLRNTAMPALIVEVGFLSHAEERKLLQTSAYQYRIAEAIAKGLQRYYAEQQHGSEALPESRSVLPPGQESVMQAVSSHIAGGQSRQLERKAKVAVVIDDLGQNYPGTAELMAIPYPLTLAIMPNLQNSQAEAKQAVKAGHQVIIHMPMAPEVGKATWLGPGAITSDLADDEIVQRIKQAIAQMPEAVGLSNHTGSKITANHRIMKIIMQELLARQLFILDSRTTDKTVIPELARTLGLPYAERTIFLDNSNSQASIQKQLDLLAATALAKGEAIGIGHVGVTGPAMVKALQNKLPEFQAQGIEIVPASELLKKP